MIPNPSFFFFFSFFFKKETHTREGKMSYNTKTIEMFGFVWMAVE